MAEKTIKIMFAQVAVSTPTLMHFLIFVKQVYIFTELLKVKLLIKITTFRSLLNFFKMYEKKTI